ncbi:MAG TPA: FtsX-like permease family protein [Blastocatellia bacterium]|nr:FtsX-like permease family protein [Blastocatellia bacterium]
MTPLNRKLVRDLFHLRGQVIAVALVVACGIATYVTMRSSYNSLVASRATYYETYRFADVFAQLKRAPESLSAEIQNIPGIAVTQTRVVLEVTLDVPGLDEPATARLVSIPERRTSILNDLYIRQGRYVEPGRRDEVLVSEAFAEANQLQVGQSLGAVINGRWEEMRIVGIALSPEYVHEIRAADVFPDRRRFGILWMSRDALGPAFDMEGAFNNVTVSLAPGASEAEVINRLDELLKRYGGLGAYGRDEQESHRFLADEIEQDRITGIVIPSIFLGVAAFLIHMVLSRLVSTQRDQIAVLKAFGYGNLAVGTHYLKFALVAVLAGTVVGTALGIWFGAELAEVYKQFFRFPVLQFEVGLETAGLAIAISAGAAFLGAILAVRRVVALPPAEAMRPEPPANFSTGLLERIGLQKVVSPAARMIVRNIERRKWKAALSILGIALAVAVLIVGRYSFDALDYIIEVHFRTAQREDATIMFNNPRTSRARFDVTHLPGVLRAETFRTVPVRLQFEHRSKRVAILGIKPDGELRTLLDRSLRKVDLPSEGLLLSAKLADVLGARPGDTITVEVLEGERPLRHLPVVRLVDEWIGLSAYMDTHALNRLMREGETVSGAYLAIDPKFATQLYSLIKRTPVVGGVAFREKMLASFLETVAASLTISTTVLIVFACVIAFAMVYNSARVALSERGHELASLRVLGFTQREVSVMLLGEQALLTLAAIPIGFAIGLGICALLARLMNTELYRMPLVVSGQSYAFAFLIIVAAVGLSGLLILRRLYNLDLVAVLKTRE